MFFMLQVQVQKTVTFAKNESTSWKECQLKGNFSIDLVFVAIIVTYFLGIVSNEISKTIIFGLKHFKREFIHKI